MTVNDLIRSSLRLTGDMGVGQQPSTDDLTDGIFVANSMFDAWSIEKLTVFDIAAQVYPLTSGKQVYAYGPGGDFSAARPNRIEAVNLVYTSGGQTLYLPIQILSRDQWESVRLQAIASPIPTQVYIEPSFPSLTCSFLPYPNAGQSVQFYTWVPLTGWTSGTDTVNLPPGYADAVRYNLAVRLAPEWGRTVKPEVLELARTSKAAIQRLNLPAPVRRCDPAIARHQVDARGLPNILTGWY